MAEWIIIELSHDGDFGAAGKVGDTDIGIKSTTLRVKGGGFQSQCWVQLDHMLTTTIQ